MSSCFTLDPCLNDGISPSPAYRTFFVIKAWGSWWFSFAILTAHLCRWPRETGYHNQSPGLSPDKENLSPSLGRSWSLIWNSFSWAIRNHFSYRSMASGHGVEGRRSVLKRNWNYQQTFRHYFMQSRWLQCDNSVIEEINLRCHEKEKKERNDSFFRFRQSHPFEI